MGIAGFMGNRQFGFGFNSYGERVPAPLPVAADVAADIDRRLHQPRFQRLVRIETMNVFEDPQENFLRSVLSIFGGSQQLHGKRKDTAFVPDDELLKRSRIASESPLDERGYFGDLNRMRGIP